MVLTRFRVLLRASSSLLLCGPLLFVTSHGHSSTTTNAPAVIPTASTVDSLAMMFQAMSQLEKVVGNKDLGSIHNEDPIITAAASELLGQTNLIASNKRDSYRADLTELAQQVSALHEAGDLDQQTQAAGRLKEVQAAVGKVKAYFPETVLADAQDKAERYTCPMHPEVVGKKDEVCPKCGMSLDQMVRMMPAASGPSAASGQAITASVRMGSPLGVGQPATAYLQLSKPDGYPVCLPDLIETHTKKIHLLIIDPSLTDYHHEHPEPTDKLGEYVFHFTPQKPGNYRLWADIRVYPMGLQQYAIADVPGATQGLPLTNRKLNDRVVVDGFTYELTLDSKKIHVGKPVHAKLRVTGPDGKGFTQLEPIMATFAHVVGFNEDFKTVMHIHPHGAPVLDPSARGGPELEFQIYALKPGFVRLYAQVQIDGKSRFAPFGIMVVP